MCDEEVNKLAKALSANAPTPSNNLTARDSMKRLLATAQRATRRALVHVNRRTYEIAYGPSHVSDVIHIFDALETYDMSAFEYHSCFRDIETYGAFVNLTMATFYSETSELDAAAKREFLLVCIIPIAQMRPSALVTALDDFAYACFVEHSKGV